jgi:hypothetical protein
VVSIDIRAGVYRPYSRTRVRPAVRRRRRQVSDPSSSYSASDRRRPWRPQSESAPRSRGNPATHARSVSSGASCTISVRTMPGHTAEVLEERKHAGFVSQIDRAASGSGQALDRGGDFGRIRGRDHHFRAHFSGELGNRKPDSRSAANHGDAFPSQRHRRTTHRSSLPESEIAVDLCRLATRHAWTYTPAVGSRRRVRTGVSLPSGRPGRPAPAWRLARPGPRRRGIAATVPRFLASTAGRR